MDERDSDLKKTQNKKGLSAQLGIFSIANQLGYGLPLLVILSLLVTTGGLIYLARQAQVKQLELIQEERSRAAAGEINAYVDDLQRKLAYLARVRGLTDLSFSIQHDLLEGLTRHNDAYEMVAILDHKGQVVMALPLQDQTLADNWTDSPPFLRAFKQQEDYVGPVESNPTNGLPEAILAVPIRNRQDKVDGVLLARINLEYLWFVVSQTKVGETGYVYVLDNRNFLIAQKGSSAETFKLQDISDQSFIQNLTSGKVDPLVAYSGLKGETVFGAIAPIRSLHWNIVVELPTSEAYAPLQEILLTMGGTSVVITILAVGLGIFFSRTIVLPLQRLTEASAQISAGDLDTRVKINSRNEVGILATAFNQMTSQLGELYTTLEQRVTARTHSLEVVANLSERLTSILNVDQLLTELVQQVKEKFGYYHVHVYLFDETGKNLVVAEGSGTAGAEMKASGHAIALNAATSLVARAARTSEIVRADNVREATDWLSNPLLPNTYAEMAVPIIVEGRVAGVLDVQEDEIAGLDEGDANLLRSLANQVAVTIRNARLFNEVETALVEAYSAQERYVEQSWEKTKIVTRQGQYHYTRSDALALSEAQKQAMAEAKGQAFEQNQLITVDLKSDDAIAPAVVNPVVLYTKPIGTLQVYPANNNQTWTEDDLAVIAAVTEQLAQTAENLRLFEETRERAGREGVIRKITEKMRASANLQELVQTTAHELGDLFSVEYTLVDLGINTSTKHSVEPANGDIH